MDDIHINLDELKLDETIFKDVKYYISGQVPEKVLDVLRLCGAECSNYFTDYVTHLICGSEPDEDDITDASDVYEIPIVTPRWVLTCARLRKRISHTGFFYDPNQLFSGLVFCFSQLRGDDKHAVWSLCTYFGGVVHHNLTAHCTHLVTYDVKTSKYLKAFSLNDRIRIVTPDWVMESVKNKSLAAAEFFHPKLLLWPKPSESTALITGFADDTEKVVDIPETESTQALLDKLKQRMPWNQPNTPTNAPANFPNFVNPTQEPAKRPQWTPPQSQPTTPQTTTNQSPFNSPEIKPRVQWTSGQAPNTQYSDTQISQTIKQEPDTNPTIQSQQKLQQPQQTQQQQLPTNQQQLPTNQQLSTNQQQLPTNQQQQLSTNQQQLPTNQQQLPTNQQVPANQQSQQIFQRIQRVQQFQNQQQTQQFNQLPQQNTQPQQIQNRTFMSPQTSQQPHLVTNQPQQYKLQNQQIGQPQVHHLPQTAGNQPKIGLITTQQQPNIQTGQLIQNRLNQFGNQQFPQQQQQNQQQFTPRVQVKQEKLPFNSQNMTQQYTVQNPQQQQNIVHQFMQTVQQRPQLHQNWQTQQLNQQQQPPQLNTQTINQQQLNQTQLNQQINQLQQGQINPQLNPQQIQQQINIQLNQTQQRIIQQQLNQQQINTQQINQQSLNNQQQLQQRLNQQIESQLNQQQQQPNQIQHQRLSQQLESQLNTQVNQAQLQQQRLTQQLESQLNSQQVTQQQQQQQRLSQQLEIPQQVNQTQILQQQQQQHQQQQQLELNPQQIRLNQQIEQQLNTPQLNQQQINQVQLNPQQQQQINQVQLNQQLQQPQQINQQQQIPQQQTIQLTPQQLQQRQLAQQQLNQTHLVQQQQLLQQQQQIQRPIGAPRLNWSPNQQPQRQLIHLDAQTHQQLQQMDPQQRALFVAKLQKQRQILLQQRQNHLLQQQQQQRGGQISVVRGGMPPGLTPQQQIQLLQQQQQQTITKQQTIVMPQHAGGAPGLSPILTDQQSHQQMQIQRQQFQRLQQLHLQREQAQKQQLQQQVPTVAIVRPPLPTQEAATVAVAVPGAVGEPVLPATPQQQLVVNAKTKTALANMLSIRLQSGGGNITPVEGEPSAAGTLRLMTAQHNAALNQTGARPQELLAIQQRRTLGNITNATGDLARAAPPTPVPTGAQPTEANKQQFSPGRVLAPPQHRHGPFYGHNPNLKLPPELFLLGCIFVVVEVERYLEETSPDWRTVIERHGGEIEPVYCSRVTHVLCETQRHGVVMQALRDFKRCVTLFWLDDVVKRKQVLPPWQALHLPTGYIDGAPASRHLISLSGFTGMERSKVRDMIKYTGAKFTSYFSRHNTVLVCAKAEGVKYQHAKKWNTPIVNVQWLTDLMLGNFAALGQIEHVKYQQFTQPVQFSFDTAIVPNLMFAWKMPINISQESYERVKRSPAPITMPPKAKKPRLDPQPMEVEENQGTELQPSQSHRVLFSMVNDTQKKTLAKIVTQLGGSLAKSYQDATHLVMPTLGRSIKLLYCIAAGIHITPDKWLIDSQLENKFLDEANFQFDTKEFNKTYACDFYQTLAVQNRDKLFANKAFFITPSVVPDRVLLKELIELSGGVVEKQRRTLQQIEAANQTVPCSYIILTHSDDLHLVYDCLKNIKGNRLKCVSTCEFILSAILSQQLGIEKYLVKVELNG